METWIFFFFPKLFFIFSPVICIGRVLTFFPAHYYFCFSILLLLLNACVVQIQMIFRYFMKLYVEVQPFKLQNNVTQSFIKRKFLHIETFGAVIRFNKLYLLTEPFHCRSIEENVEKSNTWQLKKGRDSVSRYIGVNLEVNFYRR